MKRRAFIKALAALILAPLALIKGNKTVPIEHHWRRTEPIWKTLPTARVVEQHPNYEFRAAILNDEWTARIDRADALNDRWVARIKAVT